MEVWKDIENYEGRYQVSNLGNVKRFFINHGCSNGSVIKSKSEKILSPSVNSRGYRVLQLRTSTKSYKSFTVHKLVASHFLLKPIPIKYITINHKNGIKTDNRVENLEWVTHSENMLHAFRTGLIKNNGRKALDLNDERSKKILTYKGTISNKKARKLFRCSYITIKRIWGQAL